MHRSVLRLKQARPWLLDGHAASLQRTPMGTRPRCSGARPPNPRLPHRAFRSWLAIWRHGRKPSYNPQLDVIKRLWKRRRQHATHNHLFPDAITIQRTLGQHFTWLQAHRAECYPGCDGGTFYSARTMPRRAHRISDWANRYGPQSSIAKPQAIALTPRTGSGRAVFAMSDPDSRIGRATSSIRVQYAG